MAPLSATAYFISGGIISILSLLSPTIGWALWIGLLFILIGIIKIFINRPKTHRDTYNSQPAETKTPAGVKRCFVCAAKNHESANFCGHCGHKLT